MSFLADTQWSPYVVGAGIGILSWFSFLILRNPLSCSTSFAKTSGMIERFFRGKKVEEKEYYQKVKLSINWQWMLVLGMVFGSLLSATLSGDFMWKWVPPLWAVEIGESPLIRLLGAVIGGIFLGFGARWADGCTSGHGISGTMQLTLSSWISAIFFFIGGIFAAFFLFQVLV
jgi:uncharacterized membrane protein YedE/YeeE